MSDLAFIEQNAIKNTVPPKVSKQEHFKKVTHLYMHERCIQRIGNLAPCENLQVLYLHNNDITKISHLEPLITLKHLYLQKNKISKIAGLNTLKRLKKLYLGCNEISVIEGLDKLCNLEELHVEKQRLYKGESLCFDPRSILSLAESLQVMNISHNNLTSITSLRPLKQIKILNASYNKIRDVQEVVSVVQNWFYVVELNFIGNPMAKQHRYRDTLIANTLRLVILDNKDINETTRSFIKRFEFEKTQNRLNSVSKSRGVPRNIPGNIPPPLQSEISKAVVKNLSTSVLKTTLSEESDVYLPWQALKPSVSDSGKVVPPLFSKQQRKKSPNKRVQFAVFPEI